MLPGPVLWLPPCCLLLLLASLCLLPSFSYDALALPPLPPLLPAPSRGLWPASAHRRQLLQPSTPDAARASPAPVPSTPAAPPVAPDGWPPRDAAGLPRMLLDYTHHNPNDPYGMFDSPLAVDMAALKAQGYTHWVGRYANLALTFAALPRPGNGSWLPAAGEAWRQTLADGLARQVRAARAAGLRVLVHTDLLVLPKLLVKQYGRDLRRGATRFSWQQPMTVKVVEMMLAEMFERWPDVDGLVTRTGENYVMDAPWHDGGSPFDGWVTVGPAQRQQYALVIGTLRQLVCVKHRRLLVFRTWDTQPDRLHSNPALYTAVTDQVDPHPNLVFSIKHTQVDFWRYTRLNPTLGIGRHGQLVEVQLSREYEGKGAFPNYVLRGVVAGFPEQPPAERQGLAHLIRNPALRGVFTWSRGGGWGGPYTKCGNLWPSLHAAVLTGWLHRVWRSNISDPGLLIGLEAEVFSTHARDGLGLPASSAAALRAVALLSEAAVLHSHYLGAHDLAWFRDDRVGALDPEGAFLASLRQGGQLEAFLAEKRQGTAEWAAIALQADNISGFADPLLGRHLRAGAHYGAWLHAAVAAALEVLAHCPAAIVATVSRPPLRRTGTSALQYAQAKNRLLALHVSEPCAATLYRFGDLDGSVAPCAARWVWLVRQNGSEADRQLAEELAAIPPEQLRTDDPHWR